MRNDRNTTCKSTNEYSIISCTCWSGEPSALTRLTAICCQQRGLCAGGLCAHCAVPGLLSLTEASKCPSPVLCPKLEQPANRFCLHRFFTSSFAYPSYHHPSAGTHAHTYSADRLPRRTASLVGPPPWYTAYPVPPAAELRLNVGCELWCYVDG